jgi:hypothetical protein
MLNSCGIPGKANAMGRIIGVIISIGIAVLSLSQANSAQPEPDIPPATKQLMDEAKKQAASDFKGARGQYARDTCGQKLGISAAVSDGREVARLYGAQKAIAWTDCVVDTLYPDPAKR